MQDISEQIRNVAEEAKRPLTDDFDTRRVEIIMLKFKEEPEIIDDAIHRIVHYTNWPFKLTIFDNRLNSANTSKIWNKLIKESTCDYVLVIDSDAYVPKLDPCWLTRMMESIDKTGIVIPVSDAHGGAHQQVSGPSKGTYLNRDAWSGYCFLVYKGVFEKHGFFDERFYRYGQDSEFALRTKGAVMRKDVLVRHIGGASFNSDPGKEADKLYARALFQKLTQ